MSARTQFTIAETIPPRGTVAVQQSMQQNVRILRAAYDGPANTFRIHDARIGQRSMMPCYGPGPAEAYRTPPDSKAPGVPLSGIAMVSYPVVAVVDNLTAASARFEMTFYCVVVDDEPVERWHRDVAHDATFVHVVPVGTRLFAVDNARRVFRLDVNERATDGVAPRWQEVTEGVEAPRFPKMPPDACFAGDCGVCRWCLAGGGADTHIIDEHAPAPAAYPRRTTTLLDERCGAEEPAESRITLVPAGSCARERGHPGAHVDGVGHQWPNDEVKR